MAPIFFLILVFALGKRFSEPPARFAPVLPVSAHLSRLPLFLYLNSPHGAVYPAAGLAHQARAAGARVVVLNPAPSALDEVAHQVLTGTAATLLPQLLDD